MIDLEFFRAKLPIKTGRLRRTFDMRFVGLRGRKALYKISVVRYGVKFLKRFGWGT